MYTFVATYNDFIAIAGVQVKLQEKLLEKKYRFLKPDEDFLSSFAGVVGSKWPALATSLSLSGDVIEVKGKENSQEAQALQMLKLWAARGDPTYGQLCQWLNIVSLLS